tara:strand:- start:818 stop:1303 length:486 start_codon:yes stop_codon:yes gene_type:complete
MTQKKETKVIDINRDQTKTNFIDAEANVKKGLTPEGEEVSPYIHLDIKPVAKPRMTQRDKWKQRDVVKRYYKFKDELKLLCFVVRWIPKDELEVTFVLPMPDSWSERKKRRSDGQPHKSRPDLDNLVKAFKDALLVEDSNVHTYHKMKKIWGRTGKIIVKR